MKKILIILISLTVGVFVLWFGVFLPLGHFLSPFQPPGEAKKLTSPGDCPKGHLDTVESCQGEESQGFQNSGYYYLLAKGQPNKECCADFISNISKLDSFMQTFKNWQASDCQSFAGLDGWKCFQSDKLASNGNTHYYLLAAVSKNCESGIFFSGSRRRPEQFIQQIQDLARSDTPK